MALPACAQYAGPAILSRGDAPAPMTSTPITFRPYFEITGVYDTGLAGVPANSQGQLGNVAAAGTEFVAGISGSHSWKHTFLGVDYQGDVTRYDKTTYYDGTNQALSLGIRHQFTRHLKLVLRESAGMFSRNYGLAGLEQAVPFDPSQTTLPNTDFFDNRTIYLNTQADLVYQRTARLSFDFGGDGFLTRRRSTALYGVSGAIARGDMQYRLSRFTTIGATYNYTNYSFTRIFSSTDVHMAAATFAWRISKTLELSAFAGVSRLETKVAQIVPVDPDIAALLGIVAAEQVSYTRRYLPNGSARLSHTLHNGILYAEAVRTVTPGNGLFLTSDATTFSGGYTYTGLRHWSFNVTAQSNRSKAYGNIPGRYGDDGGSLNASRQIARSLHFVLGISGNRYVSPDFPQYNRPIYVARFGFGWSPGDVPLRLW